MIKSRLLNLDDQVDIPPSSSSAFHEASQASDMDGKENSGLVANSQEPNSMLLGEESAAIVHDPEFVQPCFLPGEDDKEPDSKLNTSEDNETEVPLTETFKDATCLPNKFSTASIGCSPINWESFDEDSM